MADPWAGFELVDAGDAWGAFEEVPPPGRPQTPTVYDTGLYDSLGPAPAAAPDPFMAPAAQLQADIQFGLNNARLPYQEQAGFAPAVAEMPDPAFLAEEERRRGIESIYGTTDIPTPTRLPAEYEMNTANAQGLLTPQVIGSAKTELTQLRNATAAEESRMATTSPVSTRLARMERFLDTPVKQRTQGQIEQWNEDYDAVSFGDPKNLPSLARIDATVPKLPTAPDTYKDSKDLRPEYIQQAERDSMGQRQAIRDAGPIVGPMVAGLAQVGGSLISAAARPFSSDTADYVQARMGSISGALDVTSKEESVVPEVVQKGIAGATQSIVQMGIYGSVGKAKTALTPVRAMIAGAAVDSYNASLSEATAAGVTGAARQEYAAKQAVIEAAITSAFQLIGFGGAEDALAKPLAVGFKAGMKDALKRLPVGVLSENAEELTIAAAGELLRATELGQMERLSPENLQQIGYQTAITTTLTMGLAEGGRVAASSLRSPQEAAQFVEQHPEAAERLAESQGSRKDFADATGQDRQDVTISSKDRQAAVENVKAALDAQRQQATEQLGQIDAEVKSKAEQFIDNRPIIARGFRKRQSPVSAKEYELYMGEAEPYEGFRQFWQDAVVTTLKADPKRAKIPPPTEYKSPPPVDKELFQQLEGDVLAAEKMGQLPGDSQDPETPTTITPQVAPPIENVEPDAATVIGMDAPTPPVVENRSEVVENVSEPTAIRQPPVETPPQAEPPRELPITREDVQKVFRGAEVEDLTDAPGWRVRFKNGNAIDVRVEDKIEVPDRAKLETRLGKKLSENQWSKLQEFGAKGAFRLHSPSKQLELSTIGLIRLSSKRSADWKTLRHEAVHFAKQAGMFNEKEWGTLVRKYSSPDRDVGQQEEDIATASRAWGEGTVLASKVRKFARETLKGVGVKPDAATVEALLETEEFWSRGAAVKSVAKKTPKPKAETPQEDIASGLTPENYTQRLWQEINKAWDEGRDVTVGTHLRSTRFQPKHRESMRLTPKGSLEIREGKQWVAVIGSTLDNLGTQVGMPTLFEVQRDDPRMEAANKAATEDAQRESNENESRAARWKAFVDKHFGGSFAKASKAAEEAGIADEDQLQWAEQFEEQQADPTFALKQESTKGRKPIENITGEQETMFPGERPQENLPGQREMFDEFTSEVKAPSKARQAIEDVANERFLDPDELAEAVDHLYQFKKAEIGEFNHTLGQWLRNRGLNKQSMERAGDAANWPGFDEIADEFITNNPGFAKDSQELWDLLLQGKKELPRKHDPKFVSEAAEMLGGYGETSDPGTASIRLVMGMTDAELWATAQSLGIDVGEQADRAAVVQSVLSRFAKPAQIEPSAKPVEDDYGSSNKLVSRDAYEQAKAKLKSAKSKLFSGIPAEELAALVKVGLFHVEAGARKFSAWSARMISEMGQGVVPNLPVVWNKITTDHPDLIEGRPDLANPATDENARRLVDEVDAKRARSGEPERRADADVQREAEARLENYAEERARLMEVAREGGHLGDTGTVVAKMIVNREAVAAITSADPAKLEDAMTLIDAYRRTGTELAREFRKRRDPVETPAERQARHLAEAILTPPKKMQQKADAAKEKGDAKAEDKLRAEWAAEIANLKEKLKKLGVDLDNMQEISNDPVKGARALGVIQTAKSDRWDAAYEYWRNSILSSPATQIANIFGNAAMTGWHYTAERFTEALVNTAVRDPKGAQLGEFKHILAGMLPGLSRGAKNFLMTWRAEVPMFDDGSGTTKIDDPNIHIKGAKGRVIRIPQRKLLAVDDFSKTLIANMEVGAQAYRIAKGEGLKGEDLRDRMVELTGDLRSDAWSRAREKARELTFQQPGSDIAHKIKKNTLKAREDIPGLRYLLPFVTSPVNIFETGLRKSPLGSLGLAKRVYDGVQTGRWDGITPRVAEQILAWGIVLALASNDPEEPWITGAGDESEHGRRDTARRTFPPQSIRIGDTWYSYARIEPFATSIAMTVDWINATKSPSTSEKVKVPFTSLVGQLKNKTFLSGIGDLLTALEADDPTDKLARWASSFAVSWVPNVVRSGGRSMSDEFPQRGVWGNGQEWYSRLGKRTLQRTELGIVPDVPAYDLWGRPADRGSSPVPKTDWLWRMTIPVYTKADDVFIGDRVLVTWNIRNPEEAKHPLAPSKSLGGGKHMTDEQYGQFAKLSGEVARTMVESLPLDPKKPTEDDIELMTDAISTARREVKKRLVEAWDSGKAVAIDSQSLGQQLVDTEIGKRLNAASMVDPERHDHREKTDAEFDALMAQRKASREAAAAFLEKAGVTGDDAIERFRKAWNTERGQKPDFKPPKFNRNRSQTAYGKREAQLKKLLGKAR